MTGSSDGISFKVGALFASHFIGFGLFLPFFPMVLEQRGLTVAEIGFILCASTIARIAANPIMTGLSDHSGRRRLSIFVYSVAAASFLGFFALTSGPLAALVAVAGLMIFWSPIVPLSDAYALDVVRNHKADYGRMRLWGSVAFIVANLLGGWFAGLDASAFYIVSGIILGVLSTGFVALMLPRQLSDAQDPGTSGKDRPFLFTQPWFLLILAVLGVLQGTHAAFYGFGSLFWLEAGIGGFEVGVLWSIGVAAEVVLFYLAGRLGPAFGPLTLIIASAAAGSLRWLLFPYADTFFSAAVLQVLHGISFGAAHLGAVAYIAKLVPQRWSATGQGFLAASNGILTAAGFAASGPLFALNPAYAFWAMAAASATATFLLIAIRPIMAGKLPAED